jgi:hexosaminidase
LYFDAYQGDRHQEPPGSPHMSTLEEVYDYDPPSGAHILGVQANLWTEKIGTQDHLWYMLYPRTLALAELAWDPPPRKSWPDFLRRLPAQLARLQAEGVTFRIPAVAFAVEGARFYAVPGNATAAIARTRRGDVTISLSVPVSGGRIYYTTDGSAPSQSSVAYSGPFRVRVAQGGTTLRAYAVTSDGRSGTVSRCIVLRDRTLPASAGSRTWSSLVSP